MSQLTVYSTGSPSFFVHMSPVSVRANTTSQSSQAQVIPWATTAQGVSVYGASATPTNSALGTSTLSSQQPSSYSFAVNIPNEEAATVFRQWLSDRRVAGADPQAIMVSIRQDRNFVEKAIAEQRSKNSAPGT